MRSKVGALSFFVLVCSKPSHHMGGREHCRNSLNADEMQQKSLFQGYCYQKRGLPWWFRQLKNLPTNTGDTGDAGLIPGFGRSPGEGDGKPLQYSCLENSMDRGAWQVMVHGVAKELDTTKRLTLIKKAA